MSLILYSIESLYNVSEYVEGIGSKLLLIED